MALLVGVNLHYERLSVSVRRDQPVSIVDGSRNRFDAVEAKLRAGVPTSGGKALDEDCSMLRLQSLIKSLPGSNAISKVICRYQIVDGVADR